MGVRYERPEQPVSASQPFAVVGTGRINAKPSPDVRLQLSASTSSARQSDTARGNVAATLGVSPLQTALAWLMHRSPNILLIPGTSSRTHLRENLAAADVALDDATLTRLDSIGRAA